MLPCHPHRPASPASDRGLLASAALLLLPLLGLPPWLAVAIAGVGPLTELLGPRLASGLGRVRWREPLRTDDAYPSLPAPLVTLTRARELMATLSRRCSERLLALTQRLDPLEARARPQADELAACEALTRECLHAWHDLRRAASRFGEAHRTMTSFLERHRDALAPASHATLADAVAELLRFFDRVGQHQQLRARRLLLHAGLLARHAGRGGLALTPALRDELRDLARRVAEDGTLPYAPIGACRFDP